MSSLAFQNGQVIAVVNRSGSLALLVLTMGSFVLVMKYASHPEERLREAISLCIAPNTHPNSRSPSTPPQRHSSRKHVEAEGANMVRRVLFSADVFEPKGNDQEYHIVSKEVCKRQTSNAIASLQAEQIQFGECDSLQMWLNPKEMAKSVAN